MLEKTEGQIQRHWQHHAPGTEQRKQINTDN